MRSDSRDGLALHTNLQLADERRRRPRFAVHLISLVSLPDKGERCGVVMNLSADGMLMATASRLAIGSRASIRVGRFERPDGWVTVVGRVIRLALNREASVAWVRFLCAIEFDRSLSTSAMAALRSSAEAAYSR